MKMESRVLACVEIAIIIGVCLVMHFCFDKTWLLAGICFVVMQVFSVVGAAWGNTLARRIEQSRMQQDVLELGVALEIATGRALLNQPATP